MRRLRGFLMCIVLVALSLNITTASEGSNIEIGFEQEQDLLRLRQAGSNDLMNPDDQDDLNDSADSNYSKVSNDSVELEYVDELNDSVELDYVDEPNDSVELEYMDEPNDSVELDYTDDLSDSMDLYYADDPDDLADRDLQIHTEQDEILFAGDYDDIDWDDIPDDAMVTFHRETEEATVWLSPETKTGRSAFGEVRSTQYYIPEGMEVSPYPPGEPDNRTRNINGADDRQKVMNTKQFPYSAMCYIELTWNDGTKTAGSGTIVAKNCLVTAAHVVYNEKQASKKYPKSMKIIPGGTNAGGIYGTHDWLTISIPGNYVTPINGGIYNPSQDYAIVSMRGLVGNDTGFLNLKAYPTHIMNNDLSIEAYGYPDDKDKGYLYYGPGKIYKSNGSHVSHTADTWHGQSGGCIVEKGFPYSIIAIDIGGYVDSDLNLGIDLYNEAYKNITDAIYIAKDDY